MTTREIPVGWDIAADIPGLRRLTAECEDEQTEMMFMGPPVFDESDPRALLRGDLGEMAVNEHRARCKTCQKWEGR